MQTEQIDELLSRARQRAVSLRKLPESTYRLQFHAGFTFRDGSSVVPYLAQLGITHVYASPYLRAVPGSTHGYDVIDHCRLNPEFGSEDDYNDFVQTLATHGMNHILDTVPNHVGIATSDNPWWNDVLEHGPASRYGRHFDIAWRDSPRPELHDRVLLPTLGEPYVKVLEQGQLRLAFEPELGQFAVWYFERRFPINPRSYRDILSHNVERLIATIGAESVAANEYLSILTAIDHLPNSSERNPIRMQERRRETAVIKRRLAALTRSNQNVRPHIDESVCWFNGTSGTPHTFDALDDLLSRQCYRLAYWQIASDEINYRRFFDVNDLAALAMERLDVFEETHALTLRLLAQGKVAGLRIDHPDGLYDPEEYFHRLQSHYLLACAQEVWPGDPSEWEQMRSALLQRLVQDKSDELPLYVVAEKILASDERLPRDWAIHGTSGYHFVNMINGLFVDSANADQFTQLYSDFISDSTSFEELVYRKKRLILDVSLASELQMLSHRLGRLAQKTRRSRDFTHNGLREALAEVIACFPVYRTYITDEHVHEADQGRINSAVDSAMARNPRIDANLFAFIQDILLQHYPDSFTQPDREEQVFFAGKFQQLTAPVTAKGVEDTAFYIYNRLISLNEVGGDPACFGLDAKRLHIYLAARQRAWPYGLSALSTHDTKRSEDVRARLNVLSELPVEWREHIVRWRAMNARHRGEVTGLPSPDSNEEYLIYQSLLGAWPLGSPSPDERGTFVKRTQAYLVKAMREAKIRTSWIQPDADHEAAVREFIARICDSASAPDFLDDFTPFAQRIARLGLLNSLSQTLLKLTSPGVPDTYQGCELWDFSFVDPDNRRPVDYPQRRHCLESLHALRNASRENLAAAAVELTEEMQDGRAKLWLTWHALKCRRDHPGLFSKGEYIPLETAGEKAEHLFAFARHYGDRRAVVAVPRLVAGISSGEWGETRLIMPASIDGKGMRNILTGDRGGSFRAAELFAHFPVALLVSG